MVLLVASTVCLGSGRQGMNGGTKDWHVGCWGSFVVGRGGG